MISTLGDAHMHVTFRMLEDVMVRTWDDNTGLGMTLLGHGMIWLGDVMSSLGQCMMSQDTEDVMLGHDMMTCLGHT